MEEKDEAKIWVAVRADIVDAMGLGKALVQAGHAFGNGMVAALSSHPREMAEYLASATPKVSVLVKNEAALLRVAEEAARAGIAHHLVTDAGRTVFAEPTRTMCSFGPCRRDNLPPYLRRLRMVPAGTGDAAGPAGAGQPPQDGLRAFLERHSIALWSGTEQGRAAAEPEAALLGGSLLMELASARYGIYTADGGRRAVDADALVGRPVADGTRALVPLADATLVVVPTRRQGEACGESAGRIANRGRPLCEVEVRTARPRGEIPTLVPTASRRELFERLDAQSAHRLLAEGEGDLHCIGGPDGWRGMREVMALIGQAAVDEGIAARCVTFHQTSPDTRPSAWLSSYVTLNYHVEGASDHWTTRALQHVAAVHMPCRTGPTHGRAFTVEIPPRPASATLRAAEAAPRKRVADFLRRTGASAGLVAEAMGGAR